MYLVVNFNLFLKKEKVDQELLIFKGFALLKCFFKGFAFLKC